MQHLFLDPLCCFIPHLDTVAYIFLQGAKGVTAWKAPPEPERKPAPREPSIDQKDAVNRLSQGLSVKEVKQSARQRVAAENALQARYAAAVVLDQQPGQQEAAPAPPRPVAVIRQQMFHFDAEHREQMLTGGAGQGLGGGSVYGGGSVGAGGASMSAQPSVTDRGGVGGRGVSGAGRAYTSGQRAGMNVITPTPLAVATEPPAVMLNGRQLPITSNPHAAVLPHRYPPKKAMSQNVYKDYDYAV